MTGTLKSTKKMLRIACALFVIFFIFFAFTLLPLQVRAANTAVAAIPVGGRPFGLAITPNGAYVYVANQLDGSVSVISTATNTVTNTITGLSGASWVAITPNGAYVYVVNSGRVSVISTATNLVTATITGLSASSGIAVTPNGEYVYVSNQYGSNQYGDVSVISTATNTVTTTITGLNQPGDLAITPNGAQVYVVSGNYGTVAVISTATNIVTTTLTGFNQPYGVAITLDGEYAYVTNYDGCTVSAINTSSNTVATTIDLNYPSFRIGPTDVKMTPDGAYAYIVGEGNGIISVISLATNTVVAAITGLTGADLMAITPNGAYAYISLFMESNTIDVINVLPAVNVSPSSWTMDVGQSVQFTASPSDGSGIYTSYQWFIDGIIQNGQAASTLNYSPASVGSHSITATVTDSFGLTSSQSAGNNITVNSGLVAPIASASLGAIDQGQVSSLTSTAVTTGTSPYSYQWLEKAPSDGSYSVIGGETSPSYSFVTSGSTTIGTWSFELQVTDNVGAQTTSSVASVIVNVAPSVTVSPRTATLDIGQSQLFTATPSGGSGSYSSYQWYVGGSAQSGATTSTFNYSPASAGSYSISARVTDSLGAPSAPSNTATVAVSASPTVSVAPAGPFTMDVSQSKTLTATLSGGSDTLTYQWYLDGAAVGSNSASYSYTAAIGSHSVTCRVTDNASTPVTSPASNAVSIIVAASPTVSIAPVDPLTLTFGQTQAFTATPSGGSGPFFYQWYVDSSAVGSNSANYSYTATGSSHSVTCTVTDSASTPVTSPVSNAVSVTVNPAATPTPSSTPTPTPISTSTPTPIQTTNPQTITSTPTPTPTPTAAPSPTVPEFPTWIILPLFAVVILLSIAFVRKRIPKK